MAKTKPGFTLNELRRSVDLDGALDLSMKELKEKEVPAKELGEILSLRQLDLSINHLEFLPDNFCSALTRLTRLDLSKNRLTRLPSNFGRLVNLEHLDLYENKLTRLPTSFSQLKKLKWLDLKNNPFEEPRLVKAATLCITTKGCESCARQTVMVMADIQREEERQRQEKLRLEREAEAKKKKAEEAAQERLRLEKKQAKEKRKADAAKLRAAQVQTKEASPAKSAVNGSPKKSETRNGFRDQQDSRQARGNSRVVTLLGWIIKLVLLLAICAAGALIALTAFHANGDYSTDNLRKTWSIVTSDALTLYETGQIRVLELLTTAGAKADEFYRSESVKYYVTRLKDASFSVWNSVSARFQQVDWQKVKETVAKTAEEYLVVVGDFLKTYGPVVHAAVRDSYVWFVKTVYDGVSGLISSVM